MANIYRFRNQSVAFENTITSTISSGTNLTIANNNSSSGVPLTIFQSSLSTSAKTQLKLGVSASTNNSAILQFNYSGNASTNNSLGIGFEGSENLLQVSGITISSVLPITNTISTGFNLTLTNNSSSSQGLTRFYQPSLANASYNYKSFGVSATARNSATEKFVYTSTGSTTNYYGLGLWDQDDVLVINGNQRVGINNTAPSFTLDVTGTIRATSLISADLGLTVTGANTSVTTLSASGLITANSGLTVIGSNTSLVIRGTNESDTVKLFLGTPFDSAAPNKAAIICAGISSHSISKMHFCLNNTLDNNVGSVASVSNARMTITPDGSVGINNIAPSFTLDVTGTIRATSLISANLGVTVTGANTSVTTLSSSGLISANLGVTVTGANTSVTTLTSSGNVGIGTGTTNALLQLNNSLTNRKIVLYETANNDHQYFGLGINTGNFRYQVANTADSHVFYAGTSSTTSNEIMRIFGTGRVLVTTASTTEIVSFSSMAASLGNGHRNNMIIGKSESTNNSASYRYFHTADASTSNYTTIGFYGNDDILTIQAEKRVGINNTAPSVALDIIGSNYILNSIVVGGSLKFPPIAISTSPTTITGQTYGNGIYYLSQSNSFNGINGGESVYQAFDSDNIGTQWSTSTGRYDSGTGNYLGSTSTTVDSVLFFGEWIQIQLPVATQLYRYEIFPKSASLPRAPNIFYLAGSVDGSTWTMVDSMTGISGYTSSGKQFTVTFNILHNGFYYYRLITNKNNGGDNGITSIGSWILYANNNTVGTSTSLSPETKTLIQSGNITVTNALGAGLTVTGFDASSVIRGTSESDTVKLFLGTPFGSTSPNKAAIICAGLSDHSRSKMHFCLNNAVDNNAGSVASVSNARMTIAPDGNVGINQTTPLATLHIKQKATDGGGDFSSYDECAIVMENSVSSNKWGIGLNVAPDLVFTYNLLDRGYLSNSANVSNIDFTGQHRSKSKIENVNDKIGYIVCSNGEYDNLQYEGDITINESIPYVELSSIQCDKRVFGVISELELEGTRRTYTQGSFVSVMEKETDDMRIIINSLGEGAIWVCNENGNIQNGDYITSSNVNGIGMKQDSEFLANYTVAKATCSVDFAEPKYETRYFDSIGNIISEKEYNNSVGCFIGKFIGCTYHCG